MQYNNIIKILGIITIILGISLTTVYAVSTTPPYSNQSYYPFNNKCEFGYDSGWPYGGVGGRRCLAVDKNTGKADHLSQVWVINSCPSGIGCSATNNVIIGFIVNPPNGNSPITWIGWEPIEYRSKINAKIYMTTGIGAIGKYTATINLLRLNGGSWEIHDYRNLYKQASNGESKTYTINEYVGRRYNPAYSAYYSIDVSMESNTTFNVDFGYNSFATVDAYYSNRWNKVDILEVCTWAC